MADAPGRTFGTSLDQGLVSDVVHSGSACGPAWLASPGRLPNSARVWRSPTRLRNVPAVWWPLEAGGLMVW